MSANKIFSVVGARGTGKTPFITGGDLTPGMEETYKYFNPGLAKRYLKKNMSTLVIDEIDHFRYSKEYKMLHPDHYRQVFLNDTPGLFRTLAPLQYIPNLISRIATEKLVWNALIVLEDYDKYWHNPFTDTEKTIVGNSKQQNVDLVFPTWDWGLVPPDLFRFINYHVIFPTNSSPEGRSPYMKACYDKVCRAWEAVTIRREKPYIIVDSGI